MRSTTRALVLLLFAASIGEVACKMPHSAPPPTPVPTPEIQRGKLTGVAGSVSAEDAVKGTIPGLADLQVIITKSDGREARAYCSKSLAAKLRGGQLLEIEKIKNTDKWVVIRILPESK